jgi:transposase, IS30 family
MNNQYKQLTQKERYQIQTLKELGFSARKIAKTLQRSNKTISRELGFAGAKPYCAEEAESLACQKRTQAKKQTKCSQIMKDLIRSMLRIELSPEQISGRMKREAVSNPISGNTVYRLIYEEGWQHLLPRKGKRYKKRKGVEAGAKLIPGRVDIDERPAHVEDKIEKGHWEGDTVYCQDSYLVTLVERVTKTLLTSRVKTKTKKEVTRAINKMLKPFKSICLSITFDNGGEFADHQKIKKHLKCDVYFAKPYHSWQRGLNENTNGLLRRFFPKGMAIGSLPKKEIELAQLLINIRPRKTLNYLSPYEVLTGKRVSLIAEM